MRHDVEARARDARGWWGAHEPDARAADRLRSVIEEKLSTFRWPVRVSDWTGASYDVGGSEAHWYGEPLVLRFKTPRAARALSSLDALGFLDCFVKGEADMEGNLFLLTEIRRAVDLRAGWIQGVRHVLANLAFQNPERAKKSVKSHYDIPQEALDLYLDKVYRAYSSAIFEAPDDVDRAELTRVGTGEKDAFDSLERAQWNKFRDAVDYVAPESGETLLDVGCGYSGQLMVALDRWPFGRVVGWTHSSNQAEVGRKLLADYDSERWELHEGDYRQETRVFDHITSTGMVSHVGPRGLVPYVRNVRQRIKQGGRYVHHALMIPYDPTPHDFGIGLAFNKKYMWPGFHWFTFGTHVRALEQNGFEVERSTNLSRHYAKTTAAWYERMMVQRDEMVELVGDGAFRAKQVFLAGISGGFVTGDAHVYRIYCKAV